MNPGFSIALSFLVQIIFGSIVGLVMGAPLVGLVAAVVGWMADFAVFLSTDTEL